MRLALFDLDNTLLAGDSDYEWGQFLVERGVLEREEYESQNRAYYEQYAAGTLDIHEFLGFALRPLAAHEPADLERWHAEFMARRIRPMIGRMIPKRESGIAVVTASDFSVGRAAVSMGAAGGTSERVGAGGRRRVWPNGSRFRSGISGFSLRMRR